MHLVATKTKIVPKVFDKARVVVNHGLVLLLIGICRFPTVYKVVGVRMITLQVESPSERQVNFIIESLILRSALARLLLDLHLKLLIARGKIPISNGCAEPEPEVKENVGN